jgi:hypothetical protein
MRPIVSSFFTWPRKWRTANCAASRYGNAVPMVRNKGFALLRYLKRLNQAQMVNYITVSPW